MPHRRRLHRKRTVQQRRAPADSAPLQVNPILHLQQRLGNQAVQRSLALPSLPMLRYGSQGQAVEQLQSALNTFGQALAVDGIFGPKTHHGVRSFQGDQGLDTDGIVGPQTWGALRAATPTQTLVGDDDKDAEDDFYDRLDPKTPHTPIANFLQRLYAGNVTSGEEALRELARLVGIPHEITDLAMTTTPDNPSAFMAEAFVKLTKIAEAMQPPDGANQRDKILFEFEKKSIVQRIAEISAFASSRAVKEGLGTEAPLSPRRKAIITLGMSKIGKIMGEVQGGREMDPKRGFERPTRYGYQLLDEIFEAAFGGRGKGKYNENLQEEVKWQDVPAHTDWCGLFVMWNLRSNGVPMAGWTDGLDAQLNQMQRPLNEDPLPGDILFNDVTLDQHYAIVVEDLGGAIKTIDGNIGGQIRMQAYPKKGMVFYDIDRA